MHCFSYYATNLEKLSLSLIGMTKKITAGSTGSAAAQEVRNVYTFGRIS